MSRSDDEEENKFPLRIPENWPKEPYVETALYVGYYKLKRKNVTAAFRNRVKKLLSKYGETYKLSIHENDTVVRFKSAFSCNAAFKGLKYEHLDGVPLIVGRTINHLSYGRRRLINELKLLTVVVHCSSIRPGQGLSLKAVFERHGPIAEVNALVGKAIITFNDKESVISAIAVENDILLNGIKKTVEIFTDTLSANVTKVKISTLALIHNITEVCLQPGVQFDEKRIRSTFSQFGEIVKVDTLSENISIKFCKASSVYHALSSHDLRGTQFEPFIPPGRLQQTLSAIQPILDLPEDRNIDPPNFQSHYLESTDNMQQPPAYAKASPVVQAVPVPPSCPSVTTEIDVLPSFTNASSPVKSATNHVEIVCTMPECIEYSKQVCSTLRCLELRVGVLSPPAGARIEEIVESIKASGVVAVVFIDKCNQEQTTLSVKFYDHRNIKLKDVPLHLAVAELNKAFMGNRNDEITRAKIHKQAQAVSIQPPPINQPPPVLQLPPIQQPPPTLQHPPIHQPPPILQPQTMQHPPPALNQPPPTLQPPSFALPPSTSRTIPTKFTQPPPTSPQRDRATRKSIRNLINDRPFLLKDIDDMMKYFLDKREYQLALEYNDYIPQRVRQPPIGPFADMEKKIAKENIEDSIDDIMNRNLAENLEQVLQDEVIEKEKVSSALNSLLALGKEGLKNLTNIDSINQ